jgi:crotonobetainyl-CoA:carnitine CoA-transferase CaiB-like acyl-CoA transferase
MSGFSAITGFPGRTPLKIGVWIGDYTGALFATLGILGALHFRKRTGKGQLIDVSQGESLIRCLDWTWLYSQITGQERKLSGNRDVSISPSGVFACREGFVAVAALEDAQFQGLCRAMDRADLAADPRFARHTARLSEENNLALCAHVADWTSTLSPEEVEALADLHGFAAHRVSSARDHHGDPHLRHRGAVQEFEDPLYGKVVEYGPGPKLSASPGRMKGIAKPVGFHNDHVFRNLLNLSVDEIRELQGKRVIGTWDDRPGAKPPADWDGTKGVFF